MAKIAHPGDENDPHIENLRNHDIRLRLVNGAFHKSVYKILVQFEGHGIVNNAGVRRKATAAEIAEQGQEYEHQALRTKHTESLRSNQGTVEQVDKLENKTKKATDLTSRIVSTIRGITNQKKELRISKQIRKGLK